MKKIILSVIAVTIIIFAVFNFGLTNTPNTSFISAYSKPCNNSFISCTACARDYDKPYEPKYKCWVHNEKGQVILYETDCNKKGENCKPYFYYEYDSNNRVVTECFAKAYDTTLKKCDPDISDYRSTVFTYDNMGRLTKAVSIGRNKGIHENTYSYINNSQTMRRSDFHIAKNPFESSYIYKYKQYTVPCGNNYENCKNENPGTYNKFETSTPVYKDSLKKIIYEYNNDGLRTLERYDCDDNMQNCKTINIYKYDHNGNMIDKKLKCDIYGNHCETQNKDDCTDDNIKEEIKYENGYKIVYKKNACFIWHISKYDANDNELELKYKCDLNGNNCKGYSIITYDNIGKTIAAKSGCDIRHNEQICENYEYQKLNKEGKWIYSKKGCNKNYENCSTIWSGDYYQNGKLHTESMIYVQTPNASWYSVHDINGNSLLYKSKCNTNLTNCKECSSKNIQYKCEPIYINGQKLYK